MPSNVVKLGSPNIVPLNTSNVFFYTSMRATIVNLATVSSQTVATSVRLTTHAPTQSRSKPDDKTYKTWQWSPSSCTFLSATYVYACSVYTTLRACTQCRSHNRFSRREALLCESFNQSNIQWTMISVNRAITVVLVT